MTDRSYDDVVEVVTNEYVAPAKCMVTGIFKDYALNAPYSDYIMIRVRFEDGSSKVLKFVRPVVR